MPSDVYFADMRATGNRDNLRNKLTRLFEAAGFSDLITEGDLTAIKIHFGEMGNDGFIRPIYVRPVVDAIKQSGGNPFLTDANTLYRAKQEYFQNPQWAELADWERELAPHYTTAETMLGVNTVPFESPGDQYLQDYAASIGTENTFTRTPVAVYFEKRLLTLILTAKDRIAPVAHAVGPAWSDVVLAPRTRCPKTTCGSQKRPVPRCCPI